jgi:hypothetical protein
VEAKPEPQVNGPQWSPSHRIRLVWIDAALISGVGVSCVLRLDGEQQMKRRYCAALPLDLRKSSAFPAYSLIRPEASPPFSVRGFRVGSWFLAGIARTLRA